MVTENIVAAIHSIESGMAVRKVARVYNIPYETFPWKVNHLVSSDCRPGPPTVLSDNEEEQLAAYCVKMVDMGFGLAHNDVMLMAFRIAENSGRKHPFNKGMAGSAWFDGFNSRHPFLTLRSAQSLSHSCAAAANEEVISDYSSKLGAPCAKSNLLTKPIQIYNVDETGLTIVYKPG